MEEREARELVGEELAALRGLGYDALRARMPRAVSRRRFLGISIARLGEDDGDRSVRELTAPSGARYRLETEVLWDDEPGGDVRVAVTVDDGTSMPVYDDLVVDRAGRVVGE